MAETPTTMSRKGPYLAMFMVLVILFVTGWQAYLTIHTLVQNEDRVNQTKNILRAITDTFSEVQSVELGFRAYLVTGDEAYLSPYRLAIETLESQLSRLNKLEPEQPEQKARMKHLDALIRQRLDEVSRVVSSIDNLYEAKLAFHRDLSNETRTMSEIRSLVGEMQDAAYLLLQEQALDARGARNRVFITITITICIALITLLATFALFYQIIKQNENETFRLEELVRQRTSQLADLLAELERSNQDLQDFAFVASHDLQEPLRKIRVFSDRLQAKLGDEVGDSKDYLDRMHSAAERMAHLIDDLLEYSRVSTKGSSFQPVNIDKVISEVLETLDLKITETNATIEVGEIPDIHGDKAQIKQLLQNIIGNALKFIPEDRDPVITISSKPVTGENFQDQNTRWCDILIKDNGIGVDPQYLERIFMPFKRLYPKSQYSGTGIGLAICKKIVERHKGKITATSTEGEGTTFIIRLPLERSQPLSVAESEEPEQKEGQ
ncbi:MAG: ATP-binding protein [Ketobacteraceae bacterium]|nr:ATP-binding protein [Ketobacteraceae bacterium]